MFVREIENTLKKVPKTARAIALIGPRQSGKTTLSKTQFPDHQYFSLENPNIQSRALEDPVGFLKSISEHCILDEVQNAPELLSYLQEILDDKSDKRQFVLTGSNSFQLNEKISQSLAGRIRIFTVLPFLRSEIPENLQPKDLDAALWTGSYPRIYDEGLPPQEWIADYYNTYVQKDVRTLLNVSDLTQFDRFIRICAGRCGRLSEFSSIASEVGVSQPTAVRWASILEASFILFRLQPHFKNFNKRIIKSPKLYFYDTGLLCFLLRIQTPEQLSTHPLRGEIFENWVISEYFKLNFSRGKEPPLYFWRDQHGHEVDLVIDASDHLFPIEIKSSASFSTDWGQNLTWFNKLQNFNESMVVYGGDESFKFKEMEVKSWKSIL